MNRQQNTRLFRSFEDFRDARGNRRVVEAPRYKREEPVCDSSQQAIYNSGALFEIRSFALAMNSPSGMLFCWLPSRTRRETCSACISFSPMTNIYGTFINCAWRILAFIRWALISA